MTQAGQSAAASASWERREWGQKDRKQQGWDLHLGLLGWCSGTPTLAHSLLVSLPYSKMLGLPRGRKHTGTRSHPRKESALATDRSPPQHPQGHCPEQDLDSPPIPKSPLLHFPTFGLGPFRLPTNSLEGRSLGVAVHRVCFCFCFTILFIYERVRERASKGKSRGRARLLAK